MTAHDNAGPDRGHLDFRGGATTPQAGVAGVASSFSAVAMSLSSLTGLVKYSLAPRLSAYIWCRLPWLLVIMMTNGFLLGGFLALTFSRTRNPLRPGSIMSRMIRSGEFFSASSTALLP